MPSGSKKRKAAKKKKENPPSLASAHQSHGSDDVRHQEDDASQVSSPASSQDPRTQAGDEEEAVHGEKIVTDAPSKVVDKNAVPIEDVETTKRSFGGYSSRSSSSSGSSSSSDDESHIVKSNQAVEAVAPVVPESLSQVKGEETGSNVVIEDAVSSESIVQNVGAVVHERAQVAEETKEEKLNLFEDKAGISTTASALEPTEETCIQSNQRTATISNPKGDFSQATDDHLITSYNVPVAAPKNEASNVSHSGVAEPVVHADPRPVQTTSWKSCCGLFEVFAGSSR